ncbi:MAG: hypothetical protein RLZZ200_1042 [Pseudomonadota bacterium]
MKSRFVRRAARPLAAMFCLLAVSVATRAADDPVPWWAYGYFGPPAAGERASMPVPAPTGVIPEESEEEQTRLRQVEGSARRYSLVEIRNRLDAVDWFPEDHPAMPDIVKSGSQGMGENRWGCARCHMPNGKGRPENAPVSGQSAEYFVRQLQDMRNGLRVSSDPRKANALLMVALAKAMTDAEMRETAAYYTGLPATPWVTVVETERVPQVKPTSARLFLPVPDAPWEPIGQRILEVPLNPGEFELANSRSGLLAYVPVGSVRRGERLVTTGGMTRVGGKDIPGKTIACSSCHGPDLKGMGDAPAIAGRSPSYLVRQMYDIKTGARRSALALTMRPAVRDLVNEDFVDIAAYLGSRK